MAARNDLAYLVLDLEREGRVPFEWAVAAPYRGADPLALAWAATDDVAAMVRLLQLRGPIGDELLAALVDAGVPVRVFVREVMQLHRPVISAVVSARVRELVAAPTMGELGASTLAR